MNKLFWIFVFMLSHSYVIAQEKTDTNTTNDVGDAFTKFLTSITTEGVLDFTVILSSNQYHDDGSIRQVDALAFSSKAEDNAILTDFDLSALSRTTIKKLVADAKKSGVLLSVYQETKKDGINITEAFDTPQPDAVDSAAADVVLHPDGFVAGLEEEIGDAMDLTDNVATIQVLEYFEEGGLIKRNTTTVVHSNKVNVVESSKMTPRMVQGSAELLRKAYKIDMDDRTPLIGQLFEKEYPKFEWKVLVNASAQVTRKEISVTLAIGQEKYEIIGVRK